MRFFLPAFLLLPIAMLSASDEPTPRNIVFILCDDLNDAVAGMGRVPSAATPNLDRLRARGVTFTNAAVNSPICQPSRNSLFSGLHPRRMEHYRLSDDPDRIPALRESGFLPGCLRASGYATFGCGKVFHGGATPARSRKPEEFWDEFSGAPEYGPFPFNPAADTPLKKLLIHPRQQFLLEDEQLPALAKKFRDPFWMFDNNEMKFNFEHGFAPLEDVPPGGWHWADGSAFRFVSDADRDALPDEKSAAFAASVLQTKQPKPFFLAVGFIRPHTPLYVPQKFFDLFPPEKIPLPALKPDELAGVSPAMRDNRPYGRLRCEMLKPGGEKTYREWLQAYLASIAFMDAQLGKVLDALEAGPNAGNTVVIFTSDNGYHMGDKASLFKDTLWEGAARVPLVVAGPGIAKGAACPTPVSLVDLYPTIRALCGLPADAASPRLDGFSLVPLLRDPAAGRWDGPPIAVTAVRGLTGTHFSARSATHRYILCEDGSEELYDHRIDPLEHKNVATDPSFIEAKAELHHELKSALAHYGRINPFPNSP